MSTTRSGKKCAAVPPIMIQTAPECQPRSPAPLKPAPSDKSSESSPLPAITTGNCTKLPQINPHGGVLNYLQTANQAALATHDSHLRSADLLFAQQPPHIKQEPPPHSLVSCAHSHLHHAMAPASSNLIPSSAGLHRELPPNSLGFLSAKPLRCPNKLSPLSISASVHSGGIHQLQLPNGVIPNHLATTNPLQAQSPAYSDISSIRLTPQSPFTHGFPGEAQLRHPAARNRLKSEASYSAKMHLPPLSNTGYASGSNTDIEDAASPLNPPLHSLSPYLGSGISEIPSFPSLLSPSSPMHHLPKKRALSISPNNSDMLDFSLRSSPGGGSVGHLVGNLNPGGAHLQFKLQQRRVSVEHNQNSDGTSNMTITNQLTFSEHCDGNKKKTNTTKMDDQSKLTQQNPLQREDRSQQASEPMDFDSHSSIKSSVTSTPASQQSHSQVKDELNDPHICLWEGCGITCDHLEDLVQHIENVHIEKGKSDDFTCLWQSCIRRRKPFNARYKLLIHMRIHSGEKPNKCSVSVCMFVC